MLVVKEYAIHGQGSEHKPSPPKGKDKGPTLTCHMHNILHEKKCNEAEI